MCVCTRAFVFLCVCVRVCVRMNSHMYTMSSGNTKMGKRTDEPQEWDRGGCGFFVEGVEGRPFIRRHSSTE